MEDKATRRVNGLVPWELHRPLSRADRLAIRRDLHALLAWQTDLGRWRKPTNAVVGMPYVALYVRGRLFGCFGAEAKEPGERLARAFLSALSDTRFGGLPAEGRALLAAEVSYVHRATDVDPQRLEASFEPGTHGLGVIRPGGGTVVLLPSVARDNGWKARGMLDALVRKARVANPVAERFFSFETERVVVRLGEPAPRKAKAKPWSAEDAAAAWIARLVQTDGRVTFGINARNGEIYPPGEMHHARVAAAIQALRAHGGHARKVRLASERLATDARAALCGSRIEAWPDHPAKVGGTLAHLLRAGVDVREALLAMASAREMTLVPWHAGQVVTALGSLAPEALFRACLDDLAVHPWAPWTVLAASRREVSGDVLARAVEALVASVRTNPPHRGGAGHTEVPEVALTALTVEALRGVRPTAAVRAAIERGETFVRSWQVDPETAPAAFDLGASVGAFLGSPISSGLRADVTGHALLALGSRAMSAR
jgi:AMMECR1